MQLLFQGIMHTETTNDSLKYKSGHFWACLYPSMRPEGLDLLTAPRTCLTALTFLTSCLPASYNGHRLPFLTVILSMSLPWLLPTHPLDPGLDILSSKTPALTFQPSDKARCFCLSFVYFWLQRHADRERLMIMMSQFWDRCPGPLERAPAQLLLVRKLFLPLKIHSTIGIIERTGSFD